MADLQAQMNRAKEVNGLLRKATDHLLNNAGFDSETMINFINFRSFKSLQVAMNELSFEQALSVCFDYLDSLIANQ